MTRHTDRTVATNFEHNFTTLKAVLQRHMRNMEYTNFCGKLGLTAYTILKSECSVQVNIKKKKKKKKYILMSVQI